MREILHSVITRRRDYMATHLADPTTLTIDQHAYKKLCHEFSDLVGWNENHHDIAMIYGLRIVISDGPEWLEVT